MVPCYSRTIPGLDVPSFHEQRPRGCRHHAVPATLTTKAQARVGEGKVGLSGTATGCSLAALIPCGTRFHIIDATLYAYKTDYLLTSYNHPIQTPTSKGLRAIQHRPYPVLHSPNALPEIKEHRTSNTVILQCLRPGLYYAHGRG